MENTDFVHYTLDNGLEVGLKRLPVQTVAGSLEVFHGAWHEIDGEEGIAHLLEHNIVRGGTTKLSPQQVREVYDRFGSYDATTGAMTTDFPVGILAEDTQDYLEITSQVVFTPRLDSRILEQERGRVMREIADAKGDPAHKDHQDYVKAIYGENYPWSRYVLGKEDVVGRATGKDLHTFHSRGFYPANMQLLLAGALPNNIEELIENAFGHYPQGGDRATALPAMKPIEDKIMIARPAPELLNKDRLSDSSASLSIAMQAPYAQHVDSFAASILEDIISMRLQKTLSETFGLAYVAGASYHYAHNYGAMSLGGKFDAKRR